MPNEASYLDYFPELKGKPTDEQLSLIAHARYEIFVRQGRTGSAVLVSLGSLMIGATVAFIPLVLGGQSLVVNTIFIGAGVQVSLWVHRRLYGRLLKQGLRQVLECS